MALFSKKLRIGIELGTNKLKLAGLRKKGSLFDLEFFTVIDLVKEYGLKSFEKITDEQYVEQLQNLATKYSLKSTNVSVALPASSAIILVLKVAVAQRETELLDEIRGELKRATDENLNEMQIVCHELEDKGSADRIRSS